MTYYIQKRYPMSPIHTRAVAIICSFLLGGTVSTPMIVVTGIVGVLIITIGIVLTVRETRHTR
ncbi:MAG: hypothetical protein FWF25_02100 [Propionibacteriaceae bacterium]|nr:hypothetical protein [Propionibacteriaceae bacterium]